MRWKNCLEDKDKIPLLVVCGPTASGKTRLAVDLAKRFGGEVVNADSMQVYRKMNIGTAKPTAAEMDGVAHHLLDFLQPDEEFSVAAYVKLAREAVKEIASRGKLPILAGGTGLYIHSLIDNIQFEEIKEDPAVRAELAQMLKVHGEEHVWELLHECDPEIAAKLHPNNRGRVLRALEVYTLTGTPMSVWQKEAKSHPSPYRLCMIGLNFLSREALYSRIDTRVEEMLKAGLLQETQALLEGGYSKTAMQAIGYKELFGYLRGETPLPQAVETLKMQTRRYAKRQLTWLRRDERIQWLEVDGFLRYELLLEAACGLVTPF